MDFTDSSSDETGTSSVGGYISTSASTSGSTTSDDSDNEGGNEGKNDDVKSSDNENDNDNEYDKLRMINKVMKKFNCSRRRATKKVEKMFGEIRFEKFKLGEGIMYCLYDPNEDLTSPQDRMKKVDEIVNLMIDTSDNWRELKRAAHAASGNKSENRIFKNMGEKNWPQYCVVLFLDFVLDFEKEKILYENRMLSDDDLRGVCERLRADHKQLRHIVMEEIILQGDEAPAKCFLLDVLIRYMDPSNSKELLTFYVVDESRRRMMGNNNNLNNYSKNKFSNSIGSSYGANTSGKPRALPDGVCWDWAFGSCLKGKNCPLKHVCVFDTKFGHGLRACQHYKNYKRRFVFGNGYNNYGNNRYGSRVGRGRNNFNIYNNNRNRYGNAGGSAGEGYPPPPASRRRTGDANFTYGNWNVNSNNNDNGNNNNNNNNGSTSGMLPPSVPGMQYTMVPMLTPIDNKKKKKNNNN